MARLKVISAEFTFIMMFVGKSLLPEYLQDQEFKVYILVLFSSRFLIPLLLFQLPNVYTEWLHNIAFLMDRKGVDAIWTPYPLLVNFLIYSLYALTYNDYVLFSLVFFLLNALADTINGVIIWKVLEKSKYSYSPYMRWLYAYSPLPVMWVSMQMVFDPYVVMLLLLSIYFIKLRKLTSSSFLATLGASLKIFPIFAVISAFFSFKWHERRLKKFVIYSLIFTAFLNFMVVINP
ncbi:MAG TPA: hypothetical protein VKU94_03730, partial [Geobacterales bacterium]|nr:hypothetical protein [Geobacterales bacterium]